MLASQNPDLDSAMLKSQLKEAGLAAVLASFFPGHAGKQIAEFPGVIFLNMAYERFPVIFIFTGYIITQVTVAEFLVLLWQGPAAIIHAQQVNYPEVKWLLLR